MPITIGSNIASLKTQRQLTKTSNELASVYERLSSGQRINKASDDAAGLSIAEALKSDRRVFQQGIRNLNDGISLLNIADSAIESLTNITIRLKELAEQAANGSFGATQRASLDKEAQALSDEYFRIAKSTEFNGRKLFEGSFGELRLQAGYGLNGSIAQGLGGAIGDGTFTNRGSLVLGVDLVEISNGDLNGDGFLDIVVTDGTNNRVNLLFGNGSGSFNNQASYSVGTGPRATTLEDLNNDGSRDLVVSNALENSLSILLNNGNGSFKSATTVALGGTGYSTTVGDFNGDGLADIAASEYSSSQISIHLGRGDGSFTSAFSYISGSTQTDIKSADFNRDGMLDLAFATPGSAEVIVSFGNGDGTFSNNLTLSAGVNPFSITLADFNNDGAMDISSADFSANGVSIFLNNGTGSFSDAVSYSTLGLNMTEAGDLNGDGNVDLITNNGRVLIGNGDGTFQSVQSSPISTSSYITLGDFDNNGVLDYAGAQGFPGTIHMYLGDHVQGVAPLLEFSLKTISDARHALSQFSHKLGQLSSQRGQIGAFQSRIHIAANVLSSANENYAAAESRIRDADIAAESANLVRLQILQQASAAILGQANLQPQIALSLLKGGGDK